MDDIGSFFFAVRKLALGSQRGLQGVVFIDKKSKGKIVVENK